MKKVLFILAVLSITLVQSQTNRTDGNGSNISNNLVVAANSNPSFGSATVFFNPNKKADGSVHLFKEWNNNAVIHSSDGQRFSLKNINLNLERNTFESKIGMDSLFTFNTNNIKKVIINSKVFKNYFKDGENRVFQEVYSSPEFDILRSYKVTLVKGSANPMLNRSTDKYVQKEFYYIRQNDAINPFKLKKKNVTKLVGDEETAKNIIERVKRQ